MIYVVSKNDHDHLINIFLVYSTDVYNYTNATYAIARFTLMNWLAAVWASEFGKEASFMLFASHPDFAVPHVTEDVTMWNSYLKR